MPRTRASRKGVPVSSAQAGKCEVPAIPCVTPPSRKHRRLASPDAPRKQAQTPRTELEDGCRPQLRLQTAVAVAGASVPRSRRRHLSATAHHVRNCFDGSALSSDQDASESGPEDEDDVDCPELSQHFPEDFDDDDKSSRVAMDEKWVPAVAGCRRHCLVGFKW